jgi:hypothetical protein
VRLRLHAVTIATMRPGEVNALIHMPMRASEHHRQRWSICPGCCQTVVDPPRRPGIAWTVVDPPPEVPDGGRSADTLSACPVGASTTVCERAMTVADPPTRYSSTAVA